MKPLLERFESKYVPEPNSGCWLWVGATYRKGYGQFRFNGKMRLATHFALLTKGRVVPRGYQAMHKCDVTCCVNPDHLEIGTNAENVADLKKKGRTQWGENNVRAKLTLAEVQEIRRVAAMGCPVKTMAQRWSVSRITIYDILRGRTWITERDRT